VPSFIAYLTQQQIFKYLKHGLKANKSRLARSGFLNYRWLCHERNHQPSEIYSWSGHPSSKRMRPFWGADPGDDVPQAWWEEMLVQRFDVPEEEKPAEQEYGETSESESLSTIKSKN
jgi:hypothetical protein